MKADPSQSEDTFLQRLAAWDEALEKGQEPNPVVTPKPAGDPASEVRLLRALPCLKLLDGIRKKQHDTSISDATKLSSSAFTPLDCKLPARFGKFDLIR